MSLQPSFALEGSIRWKRRDMAKKAALSRERTSIIPAGRSYTRALPKSIFWPFYFASWRQSCHTGFQNRSPWTYPPACSKSRTLLLCDSRSHQASASPHLTQGTQMFLQTLLFKIATLNKLKYVCSYVLSLIFSFVFNTHHHQKGK